MVKLALLWHMHQPYYEDLATGEHILPWVRLHATKDYWGMVALMSEFPSVRVTFNLVPSLVLQVEAHAANRADDHHLRIGLRPPESLGGDDRAFLVANGFHAPYERMIRPLARYAELHARRLQPDTFTTADLRDLQVLHKLVWIDPDRLTTDARAKHLLAKGRDYTSEDVTTLRALELELLNAVVPAYRAAAATGQVELSTSPFYHPILPLLCDTDVHRRAHPDTALPLRLFARPDDAVRQVERAMAFHTSRFGRPAVGMWPSEGSLSDEVIGLLAAAGVQWTASDGDLLARSLGRGVTAEDLARPYALPGSPVRILFRDHHLSDAIGFSYQSWDAEAAAADFVGRVRLAGQRIHGVVSDPVVAVILDGENAWEHYAGGGRPFLRALYRRLAASHDIETVTMSEAASGPARTLTSLFPGSWINSDFYIWAGHRDDHTAWSLLADARRAYDESAPSVSEAAAALALEELLIAEGSDWFWWYGDDHSSDHDREFDDLFRRHLRNVYRALGRPVPDALLMTIITTAVSGIARPMALESTGEITDPADYRVWAAADEVALSGRAGAMHRVAAEGVERFRVTADDHVLYLRLDGHRLKAELDAGGDMSLVFERPQARSVSVAGLAHGSIRILESGLVIAVPFDAVPIRPGERFTLFAVLRDAQGHVVAQVPATGLDAIRPERHAGWVV